MKYLAYSIEYTANCIRNTLGTAMMILIAAFFAGMMFLITATSSRAGMVLQQAPTKITLVIKGVMQNAGLRKLNSQLKKLDKNLPVRIEITTRGGDLAGTKELIETLDKWKGTVTTVVYTHAMSAGATLFLVGDRRIMSKEAMLMFHTCSTGPLRTGCPSSIETWLKQYFSCKLNKSFAWVKRNLLTKDHYFNRQQARALRIAT